MHTPYTVKADGSDQPVTGDPYFDSVAVKEVSDHEIQLTNKKDGKTVGTMDLVVSPDGDTATGEFSDSSATNGGPPVTGKFVSTRVAKGPAGSHLISGSWRPKKLDGLSDNGTSWTYKTSGNEITMTNPTGQSYTAKLDGTEAPFKGDPGTTSVKVKMIGKDTLEETYLRDGKVMYVFTSTAAPGGKKLNIVNEDKRQNTTTSIEALKL